MATRLGIIGAGIMGERMVRAAVEHARDVVEVGPVWDAAPGAVERMGDVVAVRAGSAAEVITGSDCVYVATPPGTHLAYAEQALAAGRAVFLEKPLATDVAAAKAFAEQHEGARVGVNFPFASSFAVERLRGWIDEGVVGTVEGLAIRVAFRAWPRPWQQGAASWLDGAAEGGFTREVVSHFLFLARRLIGPLQLEGATVVHVPGRSERNVEARLRAGAVPVTLEGGVGTTEADDHNTWTLSGQGAGHEAVRLRDWSYAERRVGDAWVPDADAAPNERMRPLVLRRQLEGVVRMTQGEAHPLATVAEALEVQTVVEAMLHA